MSSINSERAWQGGVAASILAVGGGIIYSLVKRKKNTSQEVSDAPPVPDFRPKKKRRVLVIGAGTIGSSFASVFLARGMQVVCVDPFVSREKLKKRIAEYWPVLVSRGVTGVKIPPFEFLTKTDSLGDTLNDNAPIDFVQECTWEDVDHKRRVLAELDGLLDPDILIASSTSFIPWQLLVGQCQHKHRIMVGHPAIPHMHSFMEIYGAVPEWANHCKQWYAAAGFDVVVMKATIPGHVFNSFLRVNLDHGHKLVRQGVCSPEDVQTALRHLGRDLYARQSYLALLMTIGGDRGVEGGKELAARIQKDAVFLILFSALKKWGAPDFFAKPLSLRLGRFISNNLIPGPPEEWIGACEQFEKDITKNGQIPPQVALHDATSNMYDRIPLEVDNDPLNFNK